MAFNKIAGAFVDQSLDNYLPSIKSNTSINDNLWYTYNNNSATPINGAGTSNLIVSTTETNGLRISKNNSSFFGHGISSSFAVAKRHLAKVLQIVFDVEFISGNYSKGDIKVYIIANPDTSPILIEPVNVEISTGVAGFSIRHIASFQTHITITSYKICLHIANTNTSAYTLEFSNFKVWEPTQSIGAIITDWQSYTPTYSSGMGTVTTNYSRWRRVGGNLEIEGSATLSGSQTSGGALISLPVGLLIDRSLSGTNRIVYGILIQQNFSGQSFYLSSDQAQGIATSLIISAQTASTRSPYYSIESNVLGTGSISWKAEVPISGWGSNVAMSSDTGDGRVVAARYIGNATSSPPIANSTECFLTFTTRETDTHNSFTTGSGTYTIPISGYYRINVRVGLSGTYGTNLANTLRIYRSNLIASDTLFIGAGNGAVRGSLSDTLFFNAGETVRVTVTPASSWSSVSLDNSANSVNSFSIERIPAGSQQIAATETVACSYWLTGNTASNTDAIPFGGPTGTVGRIYDTHGSMINGTFTAPVNGIYLVTSYINTNQTSSWVEVWINGSQNRRRFLVDSSGIVINSYIQLRLLAGQTLQLRPHTSFVVFGGTLDSGGTSQIEISRITL